MSNCRSTRNCLDGVPFTLHDSIKAIEQIQRSLPLKTLPLSGILDLSTFTYESSVEENFLIKQEDERLKEIEIFELQKQFQVFVEAQKNKLKNEPGSQPGVAVETSDNVSSVPLPTAFHTSMAVHRAHPPQTIGNEILVPSRPDPREKKEALEAEKTRMNKIDFKDFENEHDPFEHVSLKVINDIEELDKVFLASHSMHVPPENSKVLPAPSMQVQQTASESFPVITSTITSTKGETSGCFTDWQGQVSNHHRIFTPYISQSHVYQTPCVGSLPQPELRQESSFQPEISVNNPEPSLRDYSTQGNFRNNFYFNKYHLTGANNFSIASSVTEAPNLRHAKSTPDITALDSSEGDSLNGLTANVASEKICNYLQNLPWGRYTPPLYAGRNNTGDTKPTPGDRTPTQHHVSRQPGADEFMLTEKFLAMGMNGDLVKRVVKRFSPDDKKVSNYLYCIKDLISKGHNPRVTEECLLHFNEIPVQVEKYVKAFETYHTMGFPASKIHKALEISGMEEELTLNILTHY